MKSYVFDKQQFSLNLSILKTYVSNGNAGPFKNYALGLSLNYKWVKVSIGSNWMIHSCYTIIFITVILTIGT